MSALLAASLCVLYSALRLPLFPIHLGHTSLGVCLFFGDKCHEGGNDHDIYLDILKNKDGVVWQVEDWRETMQTLSSLSTSTKT